MDRAYYLDRLYPLQDRMLAAFAGADTGFYLSGGTAALRGYLQHRGWTGGCRLEACTTSAGTTGILPITDSPQR